VPSVRFLRRAQFFRIPQEIFRIPQEVFRWRQTHPALACHPQGVEDNDPAVPGVGYGLRRFSASGVTRSQLVRSTGPSWL
jgi:hypothetical protein